MNRALILGCLVLVACGPTPTPIEDAGSGGSGGSGGTGGGTGGGDAGGMGGSAGGTAGGAGGGAGGGSNVRTITSIAVTPATLALKVGNVSGLTAMATFSDGTKADIGGSVQWAAVPTGIVDVAITNATDNLVSVTGKANGTATVTAKTGSLVSNAVTVTVGAPAPDAGTGNVEVRAVWVTRFAWTTAADVKGIIDRAAAAGFNLVYFQIRGNGDAYYKSTIVPWAKKLTGTLGKDPGWDPLQVAIDEAHLKGIQLHAYWNVHAAWPVPASCATTGGCTCQPTQGLADSCTLPEAAFAGAPEHFLRQHPEVMAVNQAGKSIDGEYYWFSAGDPLVKAHILAAATELVQKYDVDGVHLDRVRYPGQVYSYDPGSNAAYAALPTPKPSREDWQRSNVSFTVGQIYDVMKQYRPKAVLSASVWGIYKPLPGCSTSQGYGNYFQDSIGWIKDGKIDALTPMIYWDIGLGSGGPGPDCTDWVKLLDGFLAGSNGRHIVAGMHALDNNVVKPDRIRARVEYARKVGAAGTSVFASTYLEPSAWDTFKADGGVYAADAGWPSMPWR